MRVIYSVPVGEGKTFIEVAGLASEMSGIPTEDVASGSRFHAVDEAVVYAYEESTELWYPQIDLGGGGE